MRAVYCARSRARAAAQWATAPHTDKHRGLKNCDLFLFRREAKVAAQAKGMFSSGLFVYHHRGPFLGQCTGGTVCIIARGAYVPGTTEIQWSQLTTDD